MKCGSINTSNERMEIKMYMLIDTVNVDIEKIKVLLADIYCMDNENTIDACMYKIDEALKILDKEHINNVKIFNDIKYIIMLLELAIDNRGEDVELYYLFKSLLKRTKKIKDILNIEDD